MRVAVLWAVVTCATTAIAVSVVHAQPPAATAPATQPADGMPTSTPARKKHPPYKIPHWEEDYRWVETARDEYETDFTDDFKRIPVGDFRLGYGGEVRLRWEAEKNRAFLRQEQTDDRYFLHRYLLWQDLRWRDTFRVWIEGESAFEEGVDLNPTSPSFENRWDIKSAFVELRIFGDDTPLLLRVGRQEIGYGAQRVMEYGNWSNVSRRYDAVKLMWQSKDFDADVFWARPMDISPLLGRDKSYDRHDEDTDLIGVYTTYKGIPNHKIEAYFLTLLKTDPPANANGRRGNMQVYTLGGRFSGKTGDWDYDLEGGYQTGEWGDDQVAAFMFTGETGYTFSNAPFTPRLLAALDYASGDRHPRDTRHTTWNQLFQTGHGWFGYADLVGRQNIIDPRLGATLKITPQLTITFDQHFFFLAERQDALYNSAGSPTRRDRTGRSGRYVGTESDLVIKYAIDHHSTIEIGYCHFEGGGWMQRTGPERPVEFFYVQYLLRF